MTLLVVCQIDGYALWQWFMGYQDWNEREARTGRFCGNVDGVVMPWQRMGEEMHGLWVSGPALTVLFGWHEGHLACEKLDVGLLVDDDLAWALHVLWLQLSPALPSSLAPINRLPRFTWKVALHMERDYEVHVVYPRDRPKRTWKEIVWLRQIWKICSIYEEVWQ